MKKYLLFFSAAGLLLSVSGEAMLLFGAWGGLPFLLNPYAFPVIVPDASGYVSILCFPAALAGNVATYALFGLIFHGCRSNRFLLPVPYVLLGSYWLVLAARFCG